MTNRILLSLLVLLGVNALSAAQSMSKESSKDLYDRCRKALGTGGIYRAYIDGSGRLICYHADIETGAVYNHRTGGKYNFGSQKSNKPQKYDSKLNK